MLVPRSPPPCRQKEIFFLPLQHQIKSMYDHQLGLKNILNYARVMLKEYLQMVSFSSLANVLLKSFPILLQENKQNRSFYCRALVQEVTQHFVRIPTKT